MTSRTASDRLPPFIDLEAYSVREVIIACLSHFDEAVASRPNPIFDGQELRAYYKRYHPEVQELFEQSKVIRGYYERYHPELQELFEQFKLWVDSLGGAENAGSSLESQLGSHPILVDMVKVFIRKMMHELTYYTTATAHTIANLSHGVRGVSRCIESLDWIVELVPIVQMRRRRSGGIFDPDKLPELRLYLEWLLDHDKVDASRLSDIQNLLGHTNLVKTLDDPSNLPETILRGLVPLFRYLDALLAYRVEKTRYGFGFTDLGLPKGLERLIPERGRGPAIMSLVGKVLRKQSRLPESILQELVPFLKYHDRLFHTWWSPPDVELIFLDQSRLPETILHDIAAFIQVPGHKADLIALEILGEQHGHLPESPEAVDILKQQRHKARRAAFKILCKQLGYSPGLPEAVVQKMLALFGDPDASVRVEVVDALDRQPHLSDTILQGIRELLTDRDEFVKTAAIHALGRRPPLSDTILQDIVVLLNDPNGDVREAVVHALDRQPHLSDTILQGIRELLKDRDELVKTAAICALGRRPPLSDTILQDMVALLKQRNATYQVAAVRALDQQPRLPDAILQEIRNLFKEHQGVNRRLAALHFFKRRPGLPEAILQDMAALLRTEECLVRQAAAVALGGCCDLPEAIVQVLMAAALGREWQPISVRIAAVDALVQQRSLSDATLQQLETLRESDSWFFSDAAARALRGYRDRQKAQIRDNIGSLFSVNDDSEEEEEE